MGVWGHRLRDAPSPAVALLGFSVSAPFSGDGGERAGSHYCVIHDLAVRLMNGEIIHLADAHGRRWRATRDALLWVLDSGECAPAIEGDAFDVAAGLAGLLVRAAGPRTTAGPPSR